jgi:hypothetical protein
MSICNLRNIRNSDLSTNPNLRLISKRKHNYSNPKHQLNTTQIQSIKVHKTYPIIGDFWEPEQPIRFQTKKKSKYETHRTEKINQNMK